jgi:hypothetical protein
LIGGVQLQKWQTRNSGSLMIKLLDILNEGVAPDVVYHMTYLKKFYLILNSNSFKLKLGLFGAELKHNRKKFYYFSTARNRDSAYFNAFGEWSVLLTLDGRLLNAKAKAIPVDYWGRDLIGADNLAGGEKDEHEERFVTNKPQITGVDRLIKKVEILIPDKKDTSDYYSLFRKVLIILKKKNIPVYVYKDKQSFQFGNTKNAISLSDIDLDSLKNSKIDYGFWYFKMDEPKSYKKMIRRKNKKGALQQVIELYYTKPSPDAYKKLPFDIAHFLDNIEHVPSTVFDGLVRDIKSEMDLDDFEIYRDEFVSIMAKEKVTKIEDLLNMLIDRWKPVVLKVRKNG